MDTNFKVMEKDVYFRIIFINTSVMFLKKETALLSIYFNKKKLTF